MRSILLIMLCLSLNALPEEAHYFARMHRVYVDVHNLPGQRTCMFVADNGNVRFERTTANERKVAGKVYTFPLRPDQFSELKELLANPNLERSQDKTESAPTQVYDEFVVMFYEGNVFKHAKSVQNDRHTSPEPIRSVEKWFATITKQRLSENTTATANNCSQL